MEKDFPRKMNLKVNRSSYICQSRHQAKISQKSQSRTLYIVKPNNLAEGDNNCEHRPNEY
jgi:hypothetical protein